MMFIYNKCPPATWGLHFQSNFTLIVSLINQGLIRAMYSFNLLLVLVAAATSIQAFRFSDVYTPADILNLRETSKSRRNVLPATCPAVWTKVSGVLTKKFRDTSTGQCNDAARAAIRAAFHDCGSWNTTSTGGCDGSLFLAGEYTRTENLGLQTIAVYLGNLAKQFNVGVADMFQFAACQIIYSLILRRTPN